MGYGHVIGRHPSWCWAPIDVAHANALDTVEHRVRKCSHGKQRAVRSDGCQTWHAQYHKHLLKLHSVHFCAANPVSVTSMTIQGCSSRSFQRPAGRFWKEPFKP